MITLEQFIHICPRTIEPARWIDPLNASMEEFRVIGPKQAAMFIAQWAHECGEFNKLEERLMYSSAQRIVKTWPSRFTIESAQPYVRNPISLANFVYANRLGNGDYGSGDGWRFRGRGVPMLTFRNNFKFAGTALDLPLEAYPEQLKEPLVGCRCAGWFWKTNGLSTIAERGTEAAFRKVTGLVNGGQIGIDERLAYWARAKTVLT